MPVVKPKVWELGPKMSDERLESFKAWLVANGASMGTPTNDWELVRYYGSKGACVIYFNKHGRMTAVGEAGPAYKAFSEGRSYRVGDRTRRTPMSPVVRAIRTRDGDNCFYCLTAVSEEDETVEHMVAVTHEGPNHMSNYVLAHRDCNIQAGHLSVMEKVRIRDKHIWLKMKGEILSKPIDILLE